MTLKLNGWQRIGVVSVVWLVMFYWYLWHGEEQKAEAERKGAFRYANEICLGRLTQGEKLTSQFSDNCFLQSWIKTYPVYEAKIEKISKASLVAIDFGSLVLLWIAVRMLLSVYRWIEHGFAVDRE